MEIEETGDYGIAKKNVIVGGAFRAPPTSFTWGRSHVHDPLRGKPVLICGTLCPLQPGSNKLHASRFGHENIRNLWELIKKVAKQKSDDWEGDDDWPSDKIALPNAHATHEARNDCATHNSWRQRPPVPKR